MYNRLVLRRAALLLILAVNPAAAEDAPVLARNADEWCGEHMGEVLVKDAAGIWHRIEDNRPSQDEAGRFGEAWRGDLDGDGRQDLVLRHVAGCGSRECMFEAFVSCRDGTYKSAMQADYGDRVKVVKPRKKGWAVIHVRTVGEDKRPAHRYSWHMISFGPDGYRLPVK